MKFLEPNTLAHWNAAPQTHLHNFADLPVSVFAASTLKYRDHCKTTHDTVNPENEAVSFYALNHAASIVRRKFTENEPLPAWAQEIMATYTEVCGLQGERILHYLLLITTREMRHLYPGTETFWKKVQKEFGDKGVANLKNISSDGNEDTAMNKYLITPPAMTIGEYTKTLSLGFHKGSWGGSYGGKPWGDTTDALVSMLTGNTSMEILVDTGYTLAHNGGPIFDKAAAHMYSHYGSHLLTVLDVQRAGQMLELMLASDTFGITKTPHAIRAMELIKEFCPVDAEDKPTIKGYVDWKLVDSERPDKHKSPNKYAKYVGAQKQPKAKAAPVKPVITTLGGKKIKVTGTFQVFPNQTVNIVERVGS